MAAMPYAECNPLANSPGFVSSVATVVPRLLLCHAAPLLLPGHAAVQLGHRRRWRGRRRAAQRVVQRLARVGLGAADVGLAVCAALPMDAVCAAAAARP